MNLRLSMPRRIEREFKDAAKCAWDNETYALVLGTVAGDQMHVDELWFPEGIERFCTPKSVDLTELPRWLCDATEYAKDEDMRVLGSIHSHPYTHREMGHRLADHSMSERDLDDAQLGLLMGICTVQEMARNGGKTLRASIRWWGPTIPLEVEYA